MHWNDDWREELEEKNYKCYMRLCECRNTRNDIKIMAKLMYRYNSHYTPEECLDRMIEWVCEWNNQVNLIPDEEDYAAMIDYIKGR